MERKITIKISGHEYSLKVDSQEREEIIRKAASTICKKIESVSEIYPDKDAIDIIRLVALNESMNHHACKRELENLKKEVQSLEIQTSAYLDKI